MKTLDEIHRAIDALENHEFRVAIDVLRKAAADASALRPSVEKFAEEMERKMRKHDGDPGGPLSYRKASTFILHDRFHTAVAKAIGSGFTGENCADIANFAMMLSERYERRADT